MYKYFISVGFGLALIGCGGGGGNSDNSSSSSSSIESSSASSSSENNNIEFKGKEYGTVISPYTNRVWLDRNIGAERVCTSFNDDQCYGYYIQWGRMLDGHEQYASNTNFTQATSISSAGSDYIISDSEFDNDWANTVDNRGFNRIAQWNLLDGRGVCPTGFSVPSIEELEAEFETVTSNISAYNKFLKVPSSGERKNGDYNLVGEDGFLWSNSKGLFESSSDTMSSAIRIFSRGYSNPWVYRTRGLNVRCIMD